jgi:uncharacterized membrane protein YjgN (DUF898 family)
MFLSYLLCIVSLFAGALFGSVAVRFFNNRYIQHLRFNQKGFLTMLTYAALLGAIGSAVVVLLSGSNFFFFFLIGGLLGMHQVKDASSNPAQTKQKDSQASQIV